MNTIAFSLDDQLVASASDDRTVRLRDANARMAELVDLDGNSAAARDSLDLLCEGLNVASLYAYKAGMFWNVKTSVTYSAGKGRHPNFGDNVAFSSDCLLLASASADGSVKLWDTKSGAACGTLLGYGIWVQLAAFSLWH